MIFRKTRYALVLRLKSYPDRGEVNKMKKIYVLAVLAILVIGVFIAAGMAADVVQQPLSTGHTSASQLSAQAFKHREWVWVP